MTAITAHVTLLRDALEQVEWFQQKYNGRAECPWCHGYRPDSSDGLAGPNIGHRPGCRRQAALADLISAEGEPKTHEPGEPHRFRTTCEGCGEPGYLHISLVAPDEMVIVQRKEADRG